MAKRVPGRSAASDTPPRTKKVSANLPIDDFELLRQLADEQGISMTDALRRALKTSNWLRRVIKDRDRIIVRSPGSGTEREVVLIDQ